MTLEVKVTFKAMIFMTLETFKPFIKFPDFDMREVCIIVATGNWFGISFGIKKGGV